ncbi:hypothetical protein C1646_661023 [Rhizophagus diaphanus]|nr:hypothetical protein C1646_661023 [Rhizophagus diaphanus] [Rhizophagus sp. MUCL 43196]
MAQRIMRDSFGEKEVKLIAKILAKTSPNLVACTSSLSRLRKELRKLNALKAIIEATKIPRITTLSNKIQKEKSLLCKDEGIHYPDHFLLELVKERLDSYDVSNTSDKQALADVMIMLCTRSAEIKDLCIFNRGSNIFWMVRSLEDLGMSRTGILSRFLKKAEFLSETERRVKRLERDVKSLETELENLDEYVDRETVVDLIQEIVPLIIDKKGKDSSEESDSVKTIVIRENEAIPYKQ